MQLIVCGLGGAGCRIADTLAAVDERGPRSAVVDTSSTPTRSSDDSNVASGFVAI